MNSKPEIQFSSKADMLKLFSASLILIVALTAFYYFSDYLLLVRVVGLLIAAAAAIAVFLKTEIGGMLLGFAQDARSELRKVVWPSRTETFQTSLAVVVMVVLMGLFMWLLDWLLSVLVRWLTG